jgi:hypothetical protein
MAAVEPAPFRIDRFRNALAVRLGLRRILRWIERTARMDGTSHRQSRKGAWKAGISATELGESAADRMRHRVILTGGEPQQSVAGIGVSAPVIKRAVAHRGNGRLA